MNLCPVGFDFVPRYPLDIFIEDAGAIMILIFPAAICVVLWRVFVTNRTTPRGNILSLGLDERSATYTELYGHKIPWLAIFLHALVGVATSMLCVLVF